MRKRACGLVYPTREVIRLVYPTREVIGNRIEYLKGCHTKEKSGLLFKVQEYFNRNRISWLKFQGNKFRFDLRKNLIVSL